MFRGEVYVVMKDIRDKLTFEEYVFDAYDPICIVDALEQGDIVLLCTSSSDASNLYWRIRERWRGQAKYPFVVEACFDDTKYFVVGFCSQVRDENSYLRQFYIDEVAETDAGI